MNPVAITIIVGAIISGGLPILMRLPNQRKRISKLDTRKLIEQNKRAGFMRWVMLAMAIIGTQPFILLLVLLRNSQITTPLMCMILVVMYSGLLGFWIFLELFIQGKSELKFRDREKKVSKEQ